MEIVLLLWLFGLLAALVCGRIVRKNDAKFVGRIKEAIMFEAICGIMIMASAIKNPEASVWEIVAFSLLIIIGVTVLVGAAVLIYNYQRIDRLDSALIEIIPTGLTGLILTYPGSALGFLKWMGVF